MREILFRGKAANRIDGRAYRTSYKNGDWVYGLLTDVENYAGFSEMTNTNGVSGIEVDKNTVGQFTGLTDSKGTRIFEGDIIRIGSRVRFVFYGVGTFRHTRHGEYASDLTIKDANNCEVIGNIHDNPELLAVKTSPSSEEKPE